MASFHLLLPCAAGSMSCCSGLSGGGCCLLLCNQKLQLSCMCSWLKRRPMSEGFPSREKLWGCAPWYWGGDKDQNSSWDIGVLRITACVTWVSKCLFVLFKVSNIKALLFVENVIESKNGCAQNSEVVSIDLKRHTQRAVLYGWRQEEETKCPRVIFTEELNLFWDCRIF